MAQATAEKSNGTAKSYEDLSEQIATLRADLSGLTETIGKLGKAEKERLVSTVKARGDELKAAGEARYDEARAAAQGYLREGERYVQEQPGTALGIAAAVGFVVGFLMSGRR